MEKVIGTMKIIDLFNNIANKKEVPKKIKYDYDIWIYDEQMQDYYHELKENGDEIWLTNSFSNLNDYIGIIEEPKKIEHIENYVDFEKLTSEGKFDYLYEMETRIINKLNELENK